MKKWVIVFLFSVLFIPLVVFLTIADMVYESREIQEIYKGFADAI